jgi:hypothetical protein
MPTLIKKRRNAIDFLKLSLGTWISDRWLIGNNFCHHFAQLFSSSTTFKPPHFLHLFEPTITDAVNLDLCAIPMEHEIYDALFNIGATEAPEPDEFTVPFYQTYWQVVKEIVLNCGWDIFWGNHLLWEQNHTFIALIP